MTLAVKVALNLDTTNQLDDKFVNISKCTAVADNYRNVSIKPFPKQQMLGSSRLKKFADDNFKFDENGGEFSLRVP